METLKREYQEIVEAPFQDALSGLFNHGFFQLILQREVKRAERYGGIFALLIINIDNFSEINRRLGSIKSDRLLKRLGQTLRENIRDVDIAARLAEDSFAILLCENDNASTPIPITRILKAINRHLEIGVTISAGAALYPSDARHPLPLIEKAKAALTQAKKMGKNRHIMAGSQKPQPEQRPATVLVVDDEPLNCKLLAATLKLDGFQVLTANGGEEALNIVAKNDIDLILLDIMMPGMNGYKVCQTLKNSEATRMIPIIMVTALDDLEAKVKAIDNGADDFLTKPPQNIELLARTRSLIRVKQLNENLTSIENVLFSFANAVESKDHYTQGHTSRVAALAEWLGKRLKRPQPELRSLVIGGALHDLGKIAIKDELLNKNGPLNDEEWQIMRQHPEMGEKIALPLHKSLGMSLDIIRHHHEKLDGSGYPDGLQDDEISIPARIMAIVDMYDALTTDRPYRKALSEEKAYAILLEDAENGKLDRHIVKEFINMIKERR